MRAWSLCTSVLGPRGPAASGALLFALVVWLSFGAVASGQLSSPTPLSETSPHQDSPRVAAVPQGGPPACWCFEDSGEPVDLNAPAAMDAPTEMLAQPAGMFAQPVEMPYGPVDVYGPVEEIPDPVTYLHLRHSSTHGRNVGRGWPLVGTSWLNRPYFAGFALGPMWMTRRPDDTVGRDIDLFGDIFVGWDWDHYWGSELEIAWSTPELINSQNPYVQRSDRMSFWTFSHLYYPWGDSLVRPYFRAGIGTTEISFPWDNGEVCHEHLLTFPLGIGLKYPLRRWLVARMELADYIALGEHGVAGQANVMLTFGLEWRFGVHPRAYWPWNPSRHYR